LWTLPFHTKVRRYNWPQVFPPYQISVCDIERFVGTFTGFGGKAMGECKQFRISEIYHRIEILFAAWEYQFFAKGFCDAAVGSQSASHHPATAFRKSHNLVWPQNAVRESPALLITNLL
jgi:hypothetical protein